MNVFNKRKLVGSDCVYEQLENPLNKKRKLSRRLEDGGHYLMIRDSRGHGTTLEVMRDLALDEPRGMCVNAHESCSKYLPDLKGFKDAFYGFLRDDESLRGKVRAREAFFKRCCGASASMDNPGHLLLAMRGLAGEDISEVTSAYIKTLQKFFGSDPRRVLTMHSGICKILGSAYCATPMPAGAPPTVCHITIMHELLIASCPNLFYGSPCTEEERAEMIRVLRAWHCPAYLRNISETESRLWSFDRPRERAAVFAKVNDDVI